MCTPTEPEPKRGFSATGNAKPFRPASTRPPPTDASAARKARSSATRRPALVSKTFGIGGLVLVSRAFEDRHRRVTRRADAAPANDRDEGPPEDVEVETEARVVDVPDVERELLLPRDRVPAAHLGEPGDPRAHVVTSRLLGGVALEVLHQERARPDERHVAAEHVPELRQLVERAGPEERAEPGEPGVVGLPADTGAHRAELEQRERAPLVAGA